MSTTESTDEPQQDADSSGSDEANQQNVGAGRIVLGFALSLLSAVLLFSMWDYTLNLWPVVFVAFVPAYVAAYRIFPRKLAPFAFAVAAFGYWLALLLQTGGVLSPVIVWGSAFAIGAVWFGLAVFERRFTERTRYKWFIVQLPLLWIGLEVIFAGNLLLGSNFWIGYRLAGLPQMIQPVSVVSTPALGFLLVMLNAVIALLVLKWMDSRWPQLTTVAIPSLTLKWSSITAFGFAGVWVAASLVIFAQVSNDMGPVVRVASAQSGITNTTSSGQLGEGGAQDTPEDNERNARLQAQLTRMTTDAANQGAKLVVWPEEELDYAVTSDKAAWVGGVGESDPDNDRGGLRAASP